MDEIEKLLVETDRNSWQELLVFLEHFTLPSSSLPSSLTRKVLSVCPLTEQESQRTKY